MPTFSQLITPESESTWRSRVKSFAATAGLSITNWVEQSVGTQVFEMTVAVANVVNTLIAKAIRGYASLDTSVDPGDDDPFDPDNAGRTPEPGYLSSLGQNTFGTPRTDAKRATGFVRFRNDGTVARTVSPNALILAWTVSPPAGERITYHNTTDATIYTNADGTCTIDPGSSVVMPVACDIVGSRGSCPTGALSLVTTILGCTATNESAIVGTDRQSANAYRDQCRTATARLTLDGPSSSYEQLAMRNIDGTPLMNSDTPPVPVGITRVYVSQDSSTGIVTAYYATDTGAAISSDVTAANNNIEKQCFAVPDAITFSGYAATELPIHVAGTAEIEFREGLDLATIKTAILANLGQAFKEFPVGGVDRVAGSGFVYTSDLQGIARDAYAGLYKVRITTPSGDSTSVPLGYVPTLVSSPSDWTITIVNPS